MEQHIPYNVCVYELVSKNYWLCYCHTVTFCSTEKDHYFLSISQASSEQVIKVLKSLRSGKLIEMTMYM